MTTILRMLSSILPLIKGPDGSRLPSKRLLINLPILFATVVLTNAADLAALGLSPTVIAQLTAAANLVTMFWDHWKKAAEGG